MKKLLLSISLLFSTCLAFAQSRAALEEFESIEKAWNKITIEKAVIDPVHIEKIDRTSGTKENMTAKKSPEIKKITTDNITPKKKNKPEEITKADPNQLKPVINPLVAVEKSEKKTEEINVYGSTPSGYPLPRKGTTVTSNYGYRIHPKYKVKKFHYGIDIAAPKGTKVYATAGGKIVNAGWMKGYGNYIVIKHGKRYKTAYAHLSEMTVRKRQKVKQGDVIGLVGNTGAEFTGTHLHYEVIKEGKKVNPKKYW